MATVRKQQRKPARRRTTGPGSVRRRTGEHGNGARASSDCAGEEQERADGVPIRSDTVSGFTPSPAQIKYLNALEEAVARRQPHSDTALCEKLGISRMTLWKWRHGPGFNTWLRGQMDQTSDENWPLILRRHELLAIQGSVRSAEFIAKVRNGGYGHGRGDAVDDADAATRYTVNLLVPRPGPDGELPPGAVASSTLLPLDHPEIQACLEAQGLR